ncbi:hypothetical protein HL658_23640 [Azospirillum sp. RWY-5-1]|uniref:Uncharacterized protein n=1 Tax=Azospirillum oleiclasticum TaxID=2735135 RepID=A0ABX2THC5_9PROT|nr:hypothetical protein [Azospirillum oleiclasticum]NYZ22567.1 hypothetical protein [Azospirillum oleiclasticum]
METTLDSILPHSAAVPLASLPVPAGPLGGLIAAARDRLVAQAGAAGVTLHLDSNMWSLAAINDEAVAAGSWEPMLPACDPRHRRLHPGNAAWLVGTGRDGAVVTAQAIVLYDCRDRSVGSIFQDLSALYDQPPGDAWCEVTSPLALSMRGRVAWALAGWTRPDHRGRALFPICHRATKLVGWLRWQPDAFIGFSDPDLAERVWNEGYMGTRLMDPVPGVTFNQPGLRALPMHFMAWTRAMFLGDLAEPLVEVAEAA